MGAAEAFDILMHSASRYIISKIDSEEGARVFEAALTEATKLASSYEGWPSKMDLYLTEAAANQIRSMSWVKRQFYSHYVDAAYDLVKDVYNSMRRRFVTGGEGEGWIFKKVDFNTKENE